MDNFKCALAKEKGDKLICSYDYKECPKGCSEIIIYYCNVCVNMSFEKCSECIHRDFKIY